MADVCGSGHEIFTNSVWTTFTIEGVQYTITGKKFGVGFYGARLKGHTLEILGKSDSGKMQVTKCRIVSIYDAKTGAYSHPK